MDQVQMKILFNNKRSADVSAAFHKMDLLYYRIHCAQPVYYIEAQVYLLTRFRSCKNIIVNLQLLYFLLLTFYPYFTHGKRKQAF